MDREVIADANKPERWEYVATTSVYTKLPTAQLVDTLRALAVQRPSVDLLLNATADRLEDLHDLAKSAGYAELCWVRLNLHERMLQLEASGADQAMRDLRKRRKGKPAVLPHGQDARKAAQAGTYPRVDPRHVADALGAEHVGKAPKRAAAHSPRTPARSRTRKARR